MKDHGQRLERLMQLARQGRPEADPLARPGFGTRVAARWSAGPDCGPDFVADLLRLGRRGLAFSVVILLAAVLLHRPEAPAAPDVLSAFAGIEAASVNGF